MKRFFDLFLSLIFPQSESERLFQEKLRVTTPESLLQIARLTSELPQKRMFSALNYREPIVREIIWHLKYKHQKNLSGLLANCLYPLLLEELSEKKLFENFRDPILIPIPISKSRYRERGFNQSELIAREMSLIDSHQHFEININVLYRVKDSEHQARIKDKRLRTLNSKDAFAVRNASAISKRNIILFDDVITSGATTLSAKQELLKAGARKIIIVSVAH